MNPVIHPYVIVSLAVISVVPSVVLVWYMFWRRGERRETAMNIDILTAALSRTEEAVERLSQPADIVADDFTQTRRRSANTSGVPLTAGLAAGFGGMVRHSEVTDSARSLPAARPGCAQESAAGEISPASIGKAKALLRGGISPVEVARTLSIGLGEVALLHRMIGVVEQRQAVPA